MKIAAITIALTLVSVAVALPSEIGDVDAIVPEVDCVRIQHNTSSSITQSIFFLSQVPAKIPVADLAETSSKPSHVSTDASSAPVASLAAANAAVSDAAHTTDNKKPHPLIQLLCDAGRSLAPPASNRPPDWLRYGVRRQIRLKGLLQDMPQEEEGVPQGL